MKIVFMGTPEFAVPALEALIGNNEYEVAAVFCQPDRPRGRSKKKQPCPVKTAAAKAGIPVHQPERIRRRKWRKMLEDLQADVFVVAAYGQILSQKILDAPKIGCINLHASLLPRWRGASPIHHALLKGDSETGISLMKMTLELDAGPVYAKKKLKIEPDETRLQLEKKLAQLGADLLIEQLPRLVHSTPQPQPVEEVTFASLIEKSHGQVDFNQPAIHTVRMIQAFSDWPGVFCKFRGKSIKILSASVVTDADQILQDEETHYRPGTLIKRGKRALYLVMGQNSLLKLEQIQPVGKKAQEIAAFINGYQPATGDCFTGN
ncbi:MAG: methionyl-tRNA formyltransferase [Acidobacteria bacterium]|nr:MAG: methionyl-tRNA formyltransferase [Acidobacteriota bacterium]